MWVHCGPHPGHPTSDVQAQFCAKSCCCNPNDGQKSEVSRMGPWVIHAQCRRWFDGVCLLSTQWWLPRVYIYCMYMFIDGNCIEYDYCMPQHLFMHCMNNIEQALWHLVCYHFANGISHFSTLWLLLDVTWCYLLVVGSYRVPIWIHLAVPRNAFFVTNAVTGLSFPHKNVTPSFTTAIQDKMMGMQECMEMLSASAILLAGFLDFEL